MKIMIIDDDMDMCLLTKKVLTRFGHEVNAFNNPLTAIKHAMENSPDLILLDVMLPGKSGPEIVKLLKTNSTLRDLPVIFLTGLVSGQEKNVEDEYIMVGSEKYPTIGKPYEIDRLLELVNRYS